MILYEIDFDKANQFILNRVLMKSEVFSIISEKHLILSNLIS
jgi:hypothetical protein